MKMVAPSLARREYNAEAGSDYLQKTEKRERGQIVLKDIHAGWLDFSGGAIFYCDRSA